ncbi:MerR family transcriptional regulator [Sphingomonas crusticola]|uniref:MerR family transcriptional regulator n=1 Tax=Sphingomonas crusticola TaxID=1697973 RepID=UPI000E23DB46|nr:MerR family transcriptional regulator [Sphingomonas crusticola]
MGSSVSVLNASAAARTLGVSIKALRLYEANGLLAPDRTGAGWRTYDSAQMARAREIVALRALGLGLGQIKHVVDGDARHLQAALTTHGAALETRFAELSESIAKLRRLQSDLAYGKPAAEELPAIARSPRGPAIAFDLPWPWGGERFELRDIAALTFIIGPLGSGKTRLAERLAEALPEAAFVGLDRLGNKGASARAQMDAEPAHGSRVDHALAWLAGNGAEVSEALVTLVTALEAEGPKILVIDMVEQGLDRATQQALIAYLRQRTGKRRLLFLMTRSSSILDMAAMGSDEAILFCPANHSPPTIVAPYPGAPGYEAVASCLASPEVRARTAGALAWRPQAA